MRRILLATILAVTPLAVTAQSSIAGVGLYGTVPTAMLNGGAGLILRDTVVTANCYRITIASGLVTPTLVTCPTD